MHLPVLCVEPVAINSRDGARCVLQTLTTSSCNNPDIKLVGDPAFTDCSLTLVGPILFIEIRFVPREVRKYETVCCIHENGGKQLPFLVRGYGIDPRKVGGPSRVRVSYLIPDHTSNCDFKTKCVSLSCLPGASVTSVLHNGESDRCVQFRVGPIPPWLDVIPSEGHLSASDSLSICIQHRSSSNPLLGAILIPFSVTYSSISRDTLDHQPSCTNTVNEEEVLASHTDKAPFQSISRTICERLSRGESSVSTKMTRSRVSKLSLEAKMKVFDGRAIEEDFKDDHYIGLLVRMIP